MFLQLSPYFKWLENECKLPHQVIDCKAPENRAFSIYPYGFSVPNGHFIFLLLIPDNHHKT